MAIPDRPRPITYTDPKTKTRYELSIDVMVLRAYKVPARSDDERDAERRHGPLHRIIYCAATYDAAVDRAKYLIREEGYRPERIEFVHADKEELIAFKRGEVTIKQHTEDAVG